jgi:hypothetical protein
MGNTARIGPRFWISGIHRGLHPAQPFVDEREWRVLGFRTVMTAERVNGFGFGEVMRATEAHG